jgi:hypothetical protein
MTRGRRQFPRRPVPTLGAIAASVIRDFPKANDEERIDVCQDRASFEGIVPAPTRDATMKALAAAQGARR